MKVLQICYKLPFPGHDGGEYSIQQSALGLMKQNEIELTVLAIHQIGKSDENAIIPAEFIRKTRFKSIPVNTSVKSSGILLSLFSPKSYLAFRYHSKKFEKEIISLLQSKDFDIIQIEHVYLGIYIDILRKYSKSKIVLRAQNIEYQLWESISLLMKKPFKKKYLDLEIQKLKNFELHIINKTDAVITLTENDEKEIRKMNEAIPIKTIPVGFEFEKSKGIGTSANEKPKFYFIGSFDWLPNIQGLNWFIEEILPELIQRVPEIEIHIAGKRIPKKIMSKGNKNLIFHNSIKDSKSFISGMDILIVPLLSGGGMKVKIMEALCLGKKVICTKASFAGFESFQQAIHLAENRSEFIEQMTNVYNIFKPVMVTQLTQAHLEFDNFQTGKKMLSFYKSLI